MTEVNQKSINNLNDVLYELHLTLKNDDKLDFQYMYGSENALVIVSNSKSADEEFQQRIGELIMSTMEEPCGFVLSDGPDNYSKYTTAYLRTDSNNPYEFVLAPCAKLDIDIKEVTTIFRKIYYASKETENPHKMAAAYLYILISSAELIENSLSKISTVMSVSEKNIKNNLPMALKHINNVEMVKEK